MLIFSGQLFRVYSYIAQHLFQITFKFSVFSHILTCNPHIWHFVVKPSQVTRKHRGNIASQKSKLLPRRHNGIAARTFVVECTNCPFRNQYVVTVRAKVNILVKIMLIFSQKCHTCQSTKRSRVFSHTGR